MASEPVSWGRPMGTGRDSQTQRRAPNPKRARVFQEDEQAEWKRAASHASSIASREQHQRQRASQSQQNEEDPLDAYMAQLGKEVAEDLKRDGKKEEKERDRVEQEEKREQEEQEQIRKRFFESTVGCEADGADGAGGRLDAIPVDARCRVLGLAASHPYFRLNGSVGRVVDWQNAEQLYVLHFDRDRGEAGGAGQEDQPTDFCKLPRANVQQLVEGVRVVGLTKRPDLNGREGHVTSFDSSKDPPRYTVSLRGQGTQRGQGGGEPELVALRAENVLFPLGTRVRLEGLVNAKQHNGTWGMLVAVDEEQGRYTVKIQSDPDILLRPKFANCLA